MKVLWKYLKITWWQTLIAMLCVGLQAYTQLQLPKLMGQMTNLVQKSSIDGLSFAVNDITVILYGLEVTLVRAGTSLVPAIYKIGGIMLILSFSVLIFAITAGLFNSSVASKFGRNARNDMFKKVTEISLTEYEKFGTSTLITRTTNDIQQVQMAISMGTRVIVMSPMMLIIALSDILTNNSRLSLIFVITIPLVLLTFGVVFYLAYPLFAKIQQKIDRTTMVLRESLTGVRVIRAFNQQGREAKRYDQANQDLTKINRKVDKTMSFLNPITNIIFNITYLGVYFLGFASLNGKPFDDPSSFVVIGEVMKVGQYSMNIMFSMVMLAMIFIMIPRAKASIDRFSEVINITPSIVDPQTPQDSATNSGLVEFKNVTFAFKDAKSPSLIDINFTAKPGKMTAIIGSTGSGKSSIINLLPRFYDVNEGRVLIDGVDVRDYSQKTLRNKIGFIPQQALLFSGTVADNLKFGDENADDAALWKALEVAQAANFVRRFDQNLDVDVSQGGKNFSGGQKQRLSIARALVRKPNIYIFDDAFSALDYRTDIKLRQALKTYAKNATLIVVAQRVSTILDADNIIVLNEGKIVAQGKHHDLLQSSAVYKEIVYSQLDPDEIDQTLALKSKLLHEGEAA